MIRRCGQCLVGVLLFAGCAGPRLDAAPLDVGTIQAQLMRSHEIEANFSARQRLHFRFEDHVGALDAVLQVHCGEVVIVTLSPLGTRLFSIRQRDLEIDVEPASDASWPIAPLRVLLDVHRSFLYPLASPPPSDGWHAVRVGALEVDEHWLGGRLVQRTLLESQGDRTGRFVIRYSGGLGPDAFPSHTRLSSEVYGYELVVETLDRSESACED